ncbi:hypothetical protein [Sporisorium scitamineum]|uniref:Uncharacterized protein n=1 Tax=Sporisorium scitamineum TaxID=49012 RepID=A0A0F7S715_9BASI|nr:hypothetical protein [Sporisorium scitamineum]
MSPFCKNKQSRNRKGPLLFPTLAAFSVVLHFASLCISYRPPPPSSAAACLTYHRLLRYLCFTDG